MKIKENEYEINNNDNEYYNGKQIPIIIWIPKETFKLKIDAKYVDLTNDKVEEAVMLMSSDMIRESRDDYLLLDPDDNAFDMYAFTEKGKEFARTLFDDPFAEDRRILENIE